MDQNNKRPHLIIYAHYYYPDVASTGQILMDLAEGFLDTFKVTVICVVPSYDGVVSSGYKVSRFFEEEINGVQIVRIRVPEFTKSNKVSRVRNILGYFFGAMAATFRIKEADYIFSISQPPILGGLLGVWGKWRQKGKDGRHARFIYNIQDFNPEQIMATNYSRSRILIKVMMELDIFSCSQADLIVTVGCDLVTTLKCRFRNHNIPKHAMINNWMNESEIFPLPCGDEGVNAFRKKYGLIDEAGQYKFVIMYSGNIGLYYDLLNLVKVLKKFRKGYTQKGVYEQGARTPDGREVVFAFVGGGSVLDNLRDYGRRHHFENLAFIPYQSKPDLIYSLNAGDVHWCVSAKGIKGVSCPSKCYGIMAVGKPVLGVLEEGTEIRRLIEASGCGICCEPENYVGVAGRIRWFIENAGSKQLTEMGLNGRRFLIERLSKDISIDRYKKAILDL